MDLKSAPLLSQLTADWLARGWPLSDLASFRMDGEGGDGGAGGEGDADGDGGDGGGGDGSGDGDGDGDGTDWEAEAKKWKSQSRKHEDRAKANATAAKELDELKRASASDQEKAIQAAKDEAKAEAVKGLAPRLVAAEIKSVSAGRMTDRQREALLEGLDATKYLTDDGQVDTDKVTALIDGIAPKSDKDADEPGKGKNGKGRFPDLGQGRRGGDSKMTAQERADAQLVKLGIKKQD